MDNSNRDNNNNCCLWFGLCTRYVDLLLLFYYLLHSDTISTLFVGSHCGSMGSVHGCCK